LSEPGARLDAMADSPYEVRPLDESTWPAFAALVEANNGIFGGCWCIGFHPEGTAGSAAANRDRKLERVQAGTTHAALHARTQTSASHSDKSERRRSDGDLHE